MKALEVQDLKVQYHTDTGEIPAVRGISFSVDKGETVGIVGGSGSGKTTAMLAVMGLLGEKAQVSAAKMEICGEIPQPGKNVAMIFQDSMNCLNPSMKIGVQITETLRTRRGYGRKEARRRALELLDLAGIRNGELRMGQYPSQLSGGMRQRVVIAIALACEPELIIADEPTTALDTAVQAQILLLLRQVVLETGAGLLLVSHDLGVTASLCSRVCVMRAGELIESGSVEDIFYSPVQEYTKQLLRDAGGRNYALPAEERELFLKIRHLTKKYEAGEGLQDVSLEIRRGEMFALVGESGSGKTTLARILSGILRPDGGQILYHSLTSEKGRENTAQIQMVFQDPYASLNPRLTAGETLTEALGAYRKRDRRACRKQVEEMLEFAGLDRRDADRYPWELSGGQRQRLGIARALIVEPELLICDEALSSLDPSARVQILELLMDLQRKRKIACLFISHDIQTVSRLGGRTGVMYMGRLVECGETKEVCFDPWHPYTKMLIQAAPKPDPLRAGRMKSVPSRENESRGFPGNGAGQTDGCPFANQCGYAMDCCRTQQPGIYTFGGRSVSCFLYSEEHSGKRSANYRMTSQI